MKTRLFSLTVISIFAFVLLVSGVSAVSLATWDLTSDGSATTVDSNVNAGIFISNSVTFKGFDGTDGASAENWSTTSLDNDKYYEVTLSPKTDYILTISDINFNYGASTPSNQGSFELQYSKQSNFASPNSITIETDANQTVKTSSNSNLNIKVDSGENLTLRWFGYDFNAVTNEFFVKNLAINGVLTSIIPPEVQSCTDNPSQEELEVRGIDFSNKGLQHNTFGDDNEWFPFEEIEAEIELENNNDDFDIDDISVEWGIWDTRDSKWVIDLDEEEELDIKDGDEESLIVTFKMDDDLDVDLDELGDGEDRYRFYVMASGTVDDGLNPETETCASDFEPVTLVIEDDFVILENLNMPQEVQCEATFDVTAEIWNIGSDEQDEVSLVLTNSELGFAEDIFVGDIDEFDSQKISFSLSVPKDAAEKVYSLKFGIYDEDNEIYENDFDDDLAEFFVPLTVSGNCAVQTDLEVDASIESGGRAGEELVVRATFTNTGDETVSYNLGTGGHSWADSVSMDSSLLSLASGESKEVLFTLDVKDDVKGSQNFNIEVFLDDKVVMTQPVSVSIQEKESFLGGITGAVTGVTKDNWYLWAIGFVNLVLVVGIVIVALRIIRKS